MSYKRNSDNGVCAVRVGQSHNLSSAEAERMLSEFVERAAIPPALMSQLNRVQRNLRGLPPLGRIDDEENAEAIEEAAEALVTEIPAPSVDIEAAAEPEIETVLVGADDSGEEAVVISEKQEKKLAKEKRKREKEEKREKKEKEKKQKKAKDESSE